MLHRFRTPVALAFLTLFLVFNLTALAAADGAGTSGKINLNTADAEQLQLLPRVGPALAKRILEFREKNGTFKATEDLMLVRGIGEKTFGQMKPYLALSGDTTLQEKVPSGRKKVASS